MRTPSWSNIAYVADAGRIAKSLFVINDDPAIALEVEFDFPFAVVKREGVQAKAHFLGMTSKEDFQDKSDWDQIIFLYTDLASVDSYLHQTLQNNEQFLPHGDFGGFVTAVDAPFDPADPGEHAEESPGFTGRMRVAGNLLWSDLFALGKMQAASAEDLWPLAMHHPWQMYVGPVVDRQRCAWDKTKEEQKGHEMFQSLVASVGL